MPPSRSIPPQESNGAEVPPVFRTIRFGAAVGAAVVAASVAALPAANRVAAHSTEASTVSVWLAVVAGALVPVWLGAAVLRRAHAALRLFDVGALPAAAVVAALTGGGGILVLAVLGDLLRATTHHRGLGGTTFGILALAVVGGVVLVALGVVRIWRRVGRGVGRALAASGILLLGVEVVFIARTIHASAAASALVMDIAALSCGAALAALAVRHRDRPPALLALAGPPLATIVLVLGLAAWRASPVLATTIADEAPVLAVVPRLVLPRDAAAPSLH